MTTVVPFSAVLFSAFLMGTMPAHALAARRAEPAQAPSTISLEGGPELALVADAQRTELLGSLDLYTLAIYAEQPVRDMARLASKDTAKAIRLIVTYEDDLHSRVNIDWSLELTPRIETLAAGTLSGKFLSLRKGNVVTIEYVPSRGTTIRIDRSIAVSSAPHELMLAFLDHWLGQRPLSEDLKRSLLASSR